MENFSLIGILVFIGIVCFAFYAVDEIRTSRKRDMIIPDHKVLKAIKNIWDNNYLIDQIGYILKEEGYYNGLASKIQIFKFRTIETIEYKHWDLMHTKDFTYPEILDRIILKIKKTSAFNEIVRKGHFSETDVDHFTKLLLLYMMLSDFSEIAEKWIFKSAELKKSDKKPDLGKIVFFKNLKQP